MADDRQNRIRYYAEDAAQHYDQAVKLRRKLEYWPERPGSTREETMAGVQAEATLSIAAFMAAAELRAQLAEESGMAGEGGGR